MPEYLAPGVFVEERPPSLRAIEGVSTSTAAFIGPAERGPVAGDTPPFHSDNGFTVEADPAPVLVTSYADFVRQFGNPLRLPVITDVEDRGYLGHAVRAFFDNGGRRLYLSRIVNLDLNPSEVPRNSLRAAQGVVLRLTRAARAGDSSLSLNSLRGIGIGTTLNLRRRDGSDALLVPSTQARLTGTTPAPFAMSEGDTLTVQITGAGPSTPETSDPVTATPAKMTSAAEPFSINPGDTFQLQLGSSAPIQTAEFNPSDISTPGAATANELALVLARDLAGVSVELDAGAGTVILRSDIKGTDGSLLVTGGSAAAALGLPAATTAIGSGNVANIDTVTIAELSALFVPPPASFVLQTDSGGHLVILSTAAGAGVSIAVSGATLPLGFNAVLPVVGTGGSVAPAPSVGSYDTQNGTVTLTSPLPIDLDPGETCIQGTLSNNGPLFHARSRGSWSSSVQVNVVPTDRVAVPIVTPAVSGDSAIQVRSTASFYLGALIEIDHDGQSRSAHEVMDISGSTLSIAPALANPLGSVPGATSYARVLEIDVAVTDLSGAAPDEIYRGLSWNQRSNDAILRRHYATQINARSRLVYVQPPGVDGLSGSEGAAFADQPSTPTGFPTSLSSTAVDGLPKIGSQGDPVYVGEDLGPGQRTGIHSFADVQDINIVAAPGRTDTTVQLALIAHCEQMRYRFAVLDGLPNPFAISEIQSHRNAYDTSYAAYYAPWIGQNIGGELRYLPPSGFISGIYARVDNQRGVWKAPANESVRNAFSLSTRYTTGEQEILNPQGIDLIRRFEPGGIRVWGARTLSSDPAVKYINVRRTLIMIEASIERGMSWVPFEPNTPDTWSRVAASVRSFLRTQWREGALFGRSEDQAFFVRCDETTMTADDVMNGRLICQIGVALVRPAEFVIFRIEQLTGFAEA